MKLDPTTIIRAWRDPKFAAGLPADVRERIPANPAGEVFAAFDSAGTRGVGPLGTVNRECNTTDRTCSTVDRTCSTVDRTCSSVDRTCSTVDRTCSTVDRTCSSVDRTCSTVDRICSTVDGSCTAPVRCRTASIDAAHRAGSALAAHRKDLA